MTLRSKEIKMIANGCFNNYFVNVFAWLMCNPFRPGPRKKLIYAKELVRIMTNRR